jgi:hypothetical protein
LVGRVGRGEEGEEFRAGHLGEEGRRHGIYK